MLMQHLDANKKDQGKGSSAINLKRKLDTLETHSEELPSSIYDDENNNNNNDNKDDDKYKLTITQLQAAHMLYLNLKNYLRVGNTKISSETSS